MNKISSFMKRMIERSGIFTNKHHSARKFIIQKVSDKGVPANHLCKYLVTGTSRQSTITDILTRAITKCFRLSFPPLTAVKILHKTRSHGPVSPTPQMKTPHLHQTSMSQASSRAVSMAQYTAETFRFISTRVQVQKTQTVRQESAFV